MLRKPVRPALRLGFLEFCDPVPACMLLYVLLYFDASGFLRIGLLAAVLHECGHIAVYLLLFRRMPTVSVTVTGFCMRTRGGFLTQGQTFFLAAAGPAVNFFLAWLWALRLARRVTLWDAAFWAANVLTGAFNLLPIPPLDGAQLLAALLGRRSHWGE